jgi:hypothetical protein
VLYPAELRGRAFGAPPRPASDKRMIRLPFLPERFIAGRKIASSLSAASLCIVGYVRVQVCRDCRGAIFGCTPASKSWVAWLCRRSWKRTRGMSFTREMRRVN